MKKILVPLDFSKQAENALKVAANLARKHGGELFIIHMLELPLNLEHIAGYDYNPPEALFFMKLVEQQFDKIREKDYLKDIKYTEKVVHKEIYSGIKDAIKKHDITLVVMGSHGASGFKEMFIGSNTEKVVRTSTAPVLVVKNEYLNFEVNDFVFATDFSEEFNDAFIKAQEFTRTIGAKMHLLYVNTVSHFLTTKNINDAMAKFIQNISIENYSITVYNDLSVEKGILNFAKEINAQLIGMSTHGRKGLSHFFNGSISEDLANHATRPVITFRK